MNHRATKDAIPWRTFPMVALCLLFLTLGASAQNRTDSDRTDRLAGTLDFVSDTQQPLPPELLFLKSDDNATATSRIYDAIVTDSSASAVYHLGDITGATQISWLWKPFDKFRARLRVPLITALGNHDYFFFRLLADNILEEHLEPSSTTWSSRIYGMIAVITLNSNFSRLTDQERKAQKAWYNATLSTLSADTTVSAIIVACHHSPMTNSTIVEPSEEVRNEFVAPFLASAKARVFLSGHAHAYEHFRVGGKEFLVIGGGGGLLHPLLSGVERRYDDLANHEGNRSYFHYLTCSWTPDLLTFKVKMLRSGTADFMTADSLSIPLAR